VDACCSRVIIIDRGKLVANGLPDDLAARSPMAGSVIVGLPGHTLAYVRERLQSVQGVASLEALDASDGLLRLRVYPADADAAKGLATRLAGECQEAGWELSELQTERGRLDEVFRDITTSEGANEAARQTREAAAEPAASSEEEA